MIETVQHSHHNLLSIVSEGVPSLIASINQVVLGIMLQIGASSVIFCLCPNLSVFGFVIGLIFDQQVGKVVQKVEKIYQSHHTFFERFLFCVSSLLLVKYALPASLITATLYNSARWGALLYQKSAATQSKENPPAPISPVPNSPPQLNAIAQNVPPPINLQPIPQHPVG